MAEPMIPVADRHHRPVARAKPEATSEELLTRAGSGDRRAFELLYDRVAGPVLGLATQLLGNHSHAGDLAREVLLELWQTAPRYRAEKGNAMCWTLAIAHRRAVERARSEPTVRAREATTTFEARRDRPFDEVTESVGYHEERGQLRRCLDRLTELQRQSVTMAYYQGRTCTEVATILESPTGTVATRMRDGLIRLRDCLGITA